MGVPVETSVAGRFAAGGVTAVSSIRFARLNNSTQYTALDVVSNNTVAPLGAFKFASAARFSGGTGIIFSALMMDSVDAATNPNFSLTLFDTPNLTVAGDNLIGTVTDTEVENCVATLIFNGTDATQIATVGPNLIVRANGLPQAFKCAEGAVDLWGVINDLGGYTPAALEVFTFKLFILQD